MVDRDPEYYKPHYAGEWSKHKNDVDELEKILLEKFPLLTNAIKRGFGTDTVKYLEMKPTQKSDPSLKLNKNFDPFFCIWISGSDKVTPNDVWIRPDKVERAIMENNENNDCWFYMKYPKARFVFKLSDILPYRDKVAETNLKGPEESYIVIPASTARSENEMFDAIKKKLHPSS